MKKLIKTYKNIYTRPNDFDSMDKIRPTAILDLFQGIATDHANEIGVGYEALKAKNIAWILAKQKYVLLHDSDMYDIFDATTYPLPAGRIEYDRCYELKSNKGMLHVIGISRWCLVDFTTHRITREKAEYNGDCIEESNGLEFDKDLVKMNDLNDFTLKCEYHVNYSDLDHYHHMNNTKYGDVILNAIDKNLRIKELEIIYSHECVEGDDILVYTKEEDDIIYVFGIIKSSNLISFKSKLKVERL